MLYNFAFAKSPGRQLRELAILLLMLLLLSCSVPPVAPGDVLPAAQTTGLYVIEQAAKGSSTSFMMASKGDGLWLFAKWAQEGWLFTSVDMAAKDAIGKWVFCGGTNFTACKGMADLTEWLVNNGWNYKFPQDLPPGFVEAVVSAGGWVRALPTIPVILVTTDSFDIPSEILTAPSSDEY